ncbi:MAG: DUF3179 domain-containing protein [Pseudomonadota bacterium]
MRVFAPRIVVFLALALSVLGGRVAHSSEVEEKARALFSQSDRAKIAEALDYFKERNNNDSVGVLLLAMRFTAFATEIGETLEAITGQPFGQDWNKWMLWQERQQNLKPFEGFERIHADVHKRIDGNFQLFLGSDKDYKIRVEEITWGGVVKDGIPALTNPKLLTAEQATYMEPENLVFGVNINGDARAYPLRILDWHEMFNDVVGGVPVSLAYCTLCGSGVLFETKLEGFPHHLTLGSSGFLYRSNKLMYDTYTHSLWNQFTGEPVSGPLANSGIKLKVRPVVITTWERWQRENPSTKVISIDTGYQRDYGTGVAYKAYWESEELMFPAVVDTSEHKAKDYVFSLRDGEIQKAWPIKFFAGGKVINDTAGSLNLVLIGNEKTRTVRAYASDGIKFKGDGISSSVEGDGKTWKATEEALVAEDGTKLRRLGGHIGFWFAWQNYYGETGEVARLN